MHKRLHAYMYLLEGACIHVYVLYLVLVFRCFHLNFVHDFLELVVLLTNQASLYVYIHMYEYVCMYECVCMSKYVCYGLHACVYVYMYVNVPT